MLKYYYQMISVPQKREQYSIQLRKQKLEDIFTKKRKTALPQLDFIPQIQLQHLEEAFSNKQYDQLITGLIETEKITATLLSQGIVEELIQSERFITLLQKMIGFFDIELGFNIPPKRLHVCSRALVFLISFTYYDYKTLVNIVYERFVCSNVLLAMFAQIPNREKLLQNFDLWAEIVSDVASTFMNLLLDTSLEGEAQINIKTVILNSPLFKAWGWVVEKNIGHPGWSYILPISRIILNPPFPDESQINDHSLTKMTQFATLHFQYLTGELTFHALIVLQLISYKYPARSAVLTKCIWEALLDCDEYHPQVYAILANLTSVSDSNLDVENHLIRIGVLDNFRRYISSQRVTVSGLRKLCMLLANLLTVSNQETKSCTIHYYLPYIMQKVQNCENGQDQEILFEEVLYLLQNLNNFQQLTWTEHEQLFSQGIMQLIAVGQSEEKQSRLSQYPQKLMSVLQAILSFDSSPTLLTKQTVLQQLDNLKFNEMVEKIYLASEGQHEEITGTLERYCQKIEDWRCSWRQY